jgi:hypothetical protein
MAKTKKAINTRKKLFSKKADKEIYITLSNKVHLNFSSETTNLSAPNFEYTLIIDGVQILLLDINGTIVSPIKSTGEIFAERSTPFYLEVRAQLSTPNGSGSIQLKDLNKNKNIFDSPQEFQFPSSSNGGIFLQIIKLP